MSEGKEQRRNLLAVSVGLILYNVGGGKFVSAATAVGTVQFTRPGVLELGAWMLYVYFLWQFWLVNRAEPSFFKFCTDHISSRTWFRNPLLAHIKTNPAVLAREDEITEKDLNTNLSKANYRFTFWLLIKACVTHKVEFEITHMADQTNTPIRIVLDDKKLANELGKELLNLAFKQQAFSRTVLPYVVAGIAFVIGVLGIVL